MLIGGTSTSVSHPTYQNTEIQEFTLTPHTNLGHYFSEFLAVNMLKISEMFSSVFNTIWPINVKVKLSLVL